MIKDLSILYMSLKFMLLYISADADWQVIEISKRAIESIRIDIMNAAEQAIRDGLQPPNEGSTSQVPLKGPSSADAVIRIVELEQIVLSNEQVMAQMDNDISSLKRRIAGAIFFFHSSL